MLAYLVGTLVEKSPLEVVVDVGGVGYAASVTASTHQQLPPLGERVKLFTYLHLREDALALYGFATEEEREMFKLLLTASGVGPKTAQTILSGMNASELREAVIANDLRALTNLSGVGKKTAERIMVDLRDKITKLNFKSSPALPVQSETQQARSDAYSALLALGYPKPVAEKALRAAIAESPNAKVDELIKLALRHAQA
ncbi:MAG: Holliday junction branch migration protein RuvA [Chloroherpetonaceae bacterium]|nr:Holliday junction branch migration protein RuvA [Chloroherpetonaceae bacterium]MDW8437181.1 Holliday junction branch migration protein RuvA [Chloroherpetonaceae bacterium]